MMMWMAWVGQAGQRDRPAPASAGPSDVTARHHTV